VHQALNESAEGDFTTESDKLFRIC